MGLEAPLSISLKMRAVNLNGVTKLLLGKCVDACVKRFCEGLYKKDTLI